MKVKPMSFNTEMVQALLDGRKVQTRRPVKPQPAPEQNWRGWIIESTDRKNEGCASWADGEGSLAVWDVQGHNKKYIGNDEINALLTPDVIIPAIEDAIKRLEKSTSDIKGVLSVLEKAIEPIISGEK